MVHILSPTLIFLFLLHIYYSRSKGKMQAVVIFFLTIPIFESLYNSTVKLIKTRKAEREEKKEKKEESKNDK